jgi:hypothetical protein
MIITKEVEIKIVKSNINHYTSLGYEYELYKLITVKSEHLTKGSHKILLCKCDVCDTEKNMEFRAYYEYVNLNNIYACYKCCATKIKITNQKKYGVDNAFQCEEFKEKSKQSLFDKHGVYHPMHIQETKDKIVETCLEKYGETSYARTEDFKIKFKETNLERYGVEHESKLPEGQLKRKLTRIERGNQIPDHLVDPFIFYRKEVDKLTERIKKELFENWDGLDYYDGEYIKDNTLDNFSDYPSMDHKISVSYGFSNNIDPVIISKIENLCLTKVKINACKGNLNEEEFKLTDNFIKKQFNIEVR